MRKILISRQQHSMVQRALTWMISNLQYEWHQARAHGCNGGSYEKEIEDYKELRSYLFNENIQSGPASDTEAVKAD